MAQFRQNFASVATTINSPASITPVLPVASTPGTTLMIVCAVLGAPSITPPVGWNVVLNNVAASIAIGIFTLPNNTGNISSVPITISSTNGGAVAAIFEIIGANPILVDVTGTQNSGSSNSYGNIALAATNLSQELFLYAAASVNNTFTPSNSSDWGAALVNLACTGATTNMLLAVFMEVNPIGVTPTIGGGYSVSVSNQQAIARFQIPGSIVTARNLIAGQGGVYVGAGGNPAGTLQVPQGQGTGSFYSGSTGG